MALSRFTAAALLLASILGSAGQNPPPKPPRPPPSPPALTAWKQFTGCLTLDTPYATYAANLALYDAFVQTALTGALNVTGTSVITGVEVLSASPTSGGSLINGTAVAYQLVSATSTSAVQLSNLMATLFLNGSNPASPWRPAVPSLVASLMRLGMSSLHVAYNYCDLPSPPPSPPPVGTFNGAV